MRTLPRLAIVPLAGTIAASAIFACAPRQAPRTDSPPAQSPTGAVVPPNAPVTTPVTAPPSVSVAVPAATPPSVPAAARPSVPATTVPPRQLPIQPPATLMSLGAHRLVPLPMSVTPASGEPFMLRSTTAFVVAGETVAARADVRRIAEYMAGILRKSTGYRLPVTNARDSVPRGAIILRATGATAKGSTSPASEGYAMNISADSVQIVADAPAGLFHGVQTLRQLLPAGIEAEQSAMRMAASWAVPAGRIEDAPRFSWRGAMLDVARHWFTVDEVKQFVDILALYKLNTLHLHLSDDQGWRIQIDKWPKLVTVGGSTQVGGARGGYYTKADYAEIVRYASERFITVVPEIDMPGHTNAAIASYPQLGCSKPTPSIFGGTQPRGVYTGISVGWSTLCSEKATTYRFVEDVVRELAAMTPGPYLHIGGDEVEALTRAQYARFVERVQAIVYKHGKTMIGWEEVGKAKLRPTSIAQFWRSDTALLALRQGAKLIMSPGPRTYLDMKYTPGTELGLRWAGYIELRTAYDWDPATYAPGLTEAAVLGVEAPLWSETVQNITAAQYQVMPRLPALAEVGWSQQSQRDWEGFRTRIAGHASRWRLLGINFYPSPQVAWEQP